MSLLKEVCFQQDYLYTTQMKLKKKKTFLVLIPKSNDVFILNFQLTNSTQGGRKSLAYFRKIWGLFVRKNNIFQHTFWFELIFDQRRIQAQSGRASS